MPLTGWNQIVYQPAKAMCTVNWRSQAWLDRSYSFFIVIICLVIPYIVMIWVYVTVFREVKKATAKHRRNSLRDEQCHLQASPLTEDNANNNMNSANGLNLGQGHGHHAPGREPKRKSSVTSLIHYARRRSSLMGKSLLTFHADDSRAAKTGLIIMFTFTLCWVPFAVLITFEALVPTVTEHGTNHHMQSKFETYVPTVNEHGSGIPTQSTFETFEASGPTFTDHISSSHMDVPQIDRSIYNNSVTEKPFIKQLYKDRETTNHVIPEWVEALCVGFALTGCALNPIVYVFRSKSIKKEVKYCVCPRLKAQEALKERKASIDSSVRSRRPSMINGNTGILLNNRSHVSGLNTMIEVSSRQGSCASLDSLERQEASGLQVTAMTFHCGSLDDLEQEGHFVPQSVTFEETQRGSNRDVVPL